MIHASEAIGHTGARQTSYESGARKVLRDLLARNPEATFEDFKAALDEHEDGEQMREAALLNWFTNNCSYLARDPAFSKARYVKEAAARKAIAKRIASTAQENAAKTIAGFLFLFTPMPNGKALRYCTGREVASFGALYSKIAKTLKPDQRVSDVYRSDAEIQKLYRP